MVLAYFAKASQINIRTSARTYFHFYLNISEWPMKDKVVFISIIVSHAHVLSTHPFLPLEISTADDRRATRGK
jgi:hypothetical protein